MLLISVDQLIDIHRCPVFQDNLVVVDFLKILLHMNHLNQLLAKTVVLYGNYQFVNHQFGHYHKMQDIDIFDKLSILGS